MFGCYKKGINRLSIALFPLDNVYEVSIRFRTNRIESNFKVIRFDSIRTQKNWIRFESIRILKKNFNVILIFVSFKFQYNKKFKLILYFYYSNDQTDK